MSKFIFLCAQSTLLYFIKKTSKNFGLKIISVVAVAVGSFKKLRCTQKLKKTTKQGALNPPKNDLLLLILGVYVHLSPTITFHNLPFKIVTVL